jgi:hypothetical protein
MNSQSGISIIGKRKLRKRDLISALGCILIILTIFLGCTTDYPKEVYRGFYGIEPPESKLATLDLGEAYEVFIDDMYYVSQTKYGLVKLLAGAHRIKWTVIFGVSVMVDARGYAVYETISNVNLEAGHIYKLSADRTTGHGYKVYFWIEDITSGKIVYGEKKP